MWRQASIGRVDAMHVATRATVDTALASIFRSPKRSKDFLSGRDQDSPMVRCQYCKTPLPMTGPDGKYIHHGNCPTCGRENPYRTPPSAFLIVAALVALVLVASLWRHF
jgi:hypothetical protein